MTDFFENDSPSNLTEYTVSELSGSIKRTMETAFDRVRVRGEISGYRGAHSSGHAYFTLKDDRARLDAVIWKGAFSKLKFQPEEGVEVIATGKITIFPGSSKYQIVIETLEHAGIGALMAKFEERKKRLATEGLFDAARKQLLPYLPTVIGVVTSPTGAVIRDILHRIADRFALHVIIWPVKVQGEGSGNEVANAIAGFNALVPGGPIARPDVLIIARGGGSLEDLWSFNDENVVRAAAASEIPLISAVGHETDWTLLDYVADRRAPTPTAAAEMAVPVKADLAAEIAALSARLNAVALRQMESRRQFLRGLARALPSLDGLLAHPRRWFDEAAVGLGRGLSQNTLNKRRQFEALSIKLRPDVLVTRLSDRRRSVADAVRRAERVVERMVDKNRAKIAKVEATFKSLPGRLAGEIGRFRDRLANMSSRADGAVGNIVNGNRAFIAGQDRVLQSLSYKNVLQRGYAVVRDRNNIPVGAARSLAIEQAIIVQFADGQVHAVTTEGPDSTSKKRPARALSGKDHQGGLFDE